MSVVRIDLGNGSRYASVTKKVCRTMTKRTVLFIVLSIVLAALWLVALEVSSFNILVVSAGLMIALFLNPQGKRAHR